MAEQMQFEQTPRIPVEVYQLAARHQIGTVVEEYKNLSDLKAVLGIGAVALGGLFIVYSLAGIVGFVPSFVREFYTLSLGIAFLIYGVSQVRLAGHNLGARVYQCTEGVMRIKGSQVEAIRWDQVAEIQKFYSTVQNTYSLKEYVLRRVDGTTLTLENSFNGFQDCGRAMEKEVARCLFPGALDAYNAGHVIHFGPISVSDQGISVQNGQKVLPWNELKRVKVRNGEITIKHMGALLDWEIVPTSGMPNVRVFVALLDQITGGQKLDAE